MTNFTSKIESLSFRGLGITHSPEGKVYFVPYSWPGDEAEFEITKEKKNFGEAKIIKLITPSPQRRSEVPCPYQGIKENQCGGCPWMIASYKAQATEKMNILKSFLHRYNLLPYESYLKEIKESSQEFSYKNRAQFKTDHTKLGFYAHESHQIVDINECLVLNEEMNTKIQDIREHLKKIPRSSQQKHTVLAIDDSMSVGDLIRNKRSAFRQGHEEMNTFMKSWLSEKLNDLDRKSDLLELFSGSGNFTEVLHQKGFKNITAVDYEQTALNQIEKDYPGIKVKSLNLFDLKSVQSLKPQLQRAEIIVADPPRKGIPTLNKMIGDFVSLRDFFYISCNPDSLFKDLEGLLSKKFKIKEIQPLDAFPQTHHLEVLVHLSRS